MLIDVPRTLAHRRDQRLIWSTSAWETYYAETEEAFAENDEEVIPGIF